MPRRLQMESSSTFQLGSCNSGMRPARRQPLARSRRRHHVRQSPIAAPAQSLLRQWSSKAPSRLVEMFARQPRCCFHERRHLWRRHMPPSILWLPLCSSRRLPPLLGAARAACRWWLLGLPAAGGCCCNLGLEVPSHAWLGFFRVGRRPAGRLLGWVPGIEANLTENHSWKALALSLSNLFLSLSSISL